MIRREVSTAVKRQPLKASKTSNLTKK